MVVRREPPRPAKRQDSADDIIEPTRAPGRGLDEANDIVGHRIRGCVHDGIGDEPGRMKSVRCFLSSPFLLRRGPRGEEFVEQVISGPDRKQPRDLDDRLLLSSRTASDQDGLELLPGLHWRT
ncbi:MAG TPA: hypothetical protein VKE96_33610 [Vicinamibacterales bacterium]|nr:hypothetical protein [Vicinamibacterales bacterium]